MDIEKEGLFKIRPAGRHILTIGRDLIQDNYAAILELVKNAYDADSPDVRIEITREKNRFLICISDHGHGMSRESVLNSWLIPSTDNKLSRIKSPKGRIMQGRKGLGRYAAAVLGDDLLLETVTVSGEKTTVFLVWKDFENAEFLDNVEVLVETQQTSNSAGTKLTISAGTEKFKEWDDDELNKLRFELRKLISPIGSKEIAPKGTDSFQIELILKDTFNNQPNPHLEVLKPFPIFDFFDYRIAGKITQDGIGKFQYSTNKARNIPDEEVSLSLGEATKCGELNFDIRIYDRDRDSIEALIKKGLREDTGNYFSILKARQLLDRVNGVGVYRNGFRVRPLGDAEYDWLKLNKQRVQNPSFHIGSDQVIGLVHIQSEEQSGLIEKSARDGLQDNEAFESLNKITKAVISELESRRAMYRKKVGLRKSGIKIEKQFEKILAFDDLKDGIKTKLRNSGVNQKTTDEIVNIITSVENEKNLLIDEVYRAVAIYQGQATLGKIISVILHDGRKPLNYFKNQIPILNDTHKAYLKNENQQDLAQILKIAKGLGLNADIFVKLFSRLDPLASGRSSARKSLILVATIKEIASIFEDELKRQRITLTVSGPEDFRFSCWRQDLYAIFTNLIENSIYWIEAKKSPKREINIAVSTIDQNLQFVDYQDTGPGIDPQHISNGIIFEPQFSTKPDGTGLGLAIAGEAATRSRLELKAFESNSGAYFRLEPVKEIDL